MKSKRYFQLVERESNEISLKWKVCHTVLFIVIAINSAIATQVFAEMFNTFKCKCILSTKPIFIIDNISRFNKTEKLEITTEGVTENTVNSLTESTSELTTTIISSEKLPNPEPEIFYSNYKKRQLYSNEMENWNDTKKIPGTENYYLINNSIYFRNGSMYGEVKIKLTKTVPSSILMCDFIFFILLLSVIAASVFAGIVLIYGKGGRGYPSDTVHHGWRYVYIILIISGILFISFMIATNLVNYGVEQFCKQFSTFTGQTKCNSYIDYFTTYAKSNFKPFNTDYLFTYYTFLINTFLWGAQLSLILFRVVTIADFQFHDIVVKLKNTDNESLPPDEEEKKFQKVHQALKSKEIGTKVDPGPPADDDEDSDQNTESTARV